MSTGSGPEEAPSEGFLRPDEPTSEEQRSVTASGSRPLQDRLAVILEQILSASAGNVHEAPDPCQAELLAVAAKYTSLEFCEDPVLLELIQAVTRRMKGLSESRRIAMERSVAASLLDDQVSSGRLQHFWEQLKGLASNAQ